MKKITEFNFPHFTFQRNRLSVKIYTIFTDKYIYKLLSLKTETASTFVITTVAPLSQVFLAFLG